MTKRFEKDPTLEIIDLRLKNTKDPEKDHEVKKTEEVPKKDDKASKNIKLIPYREIELSDGHGFYIKTTCNLTSDDQVQVVQYRESPDPDGTKFSCTDPVYFENKAGFLEWLSQLIINNFDEIPYITIIPLKEEDIKRKERETTDTMYL